MAKHSSFKNLVALEACQNFFLIAGMSASPSPDETWPETPTADLTLNENTIATSPRPVDPPTE
jgi:hypothetical protein